MAVKDYLKMPELELPAWFTNFSQRLPVHQMTLGLSQTDIDQVNADTAIVQVSVQGAATYKDQLAAWVAFKNGELYGAAGGPTPELPSPPPLAAVAVPPGIISRTRQFVQRIKSTANYTTVIGQDLRIIGDEETPPAEIKPQCSVKPLPNFQAEISFVKAGYDGVTIESQRGSETTWQQIAIDLHSPYVDNRGPLTAGQPEERRYRLRYLDHDVPVGLYSDTIAATVGP